MRNIFCFIVITLSIIFLLNSCVNVDKHATKITVDSHEIPPDMKSENFILIGVFTGKERYDKILEKKFRDYTGQYVLATRNEVDSIYTDVKKYRYFLDYEMVNTVDVAWCRFFIYDRKEHKFYDRKTGSNLFGLALKVYLIAIDRVRKK